MLLYGYGNSSGHGQNGRGVDDGRVGHEGACGVCGVFRRVENDLGRVVPVLHVLLVRAVENLLVEGVIEQGRSRVKVTSAFTLYIRVVLRVVVFECGDRAGREHEDQRHERGTHEHAVNIFYNAKPKSCILMRDAFERACGESCG